MAIDKYSKAGTTHKIEKEFGYLDQLNTADDYLWLRKHADELMTESSIGLTQLKQQINQVLETDYSDFKPEIAEAKRAEKILAGRRAAMTFLKKHVTSVRENIEATKNKILRQTEPEVPSDPTKAMLQELRFQEIRQLLRGIDPRYRRDKIQGNLAYIQAAALSPDDIVSKDWLIEARREYAFKNDPSLREDEADSEQIYNFIKRRAGEINQCAVKMLMLSKLPDPLPVQEFYDVFPPQTDREKAIAGKRILSESRVNELVAKKVQQLKAEEAKERDRDERKGNRSIPHRI